MIRFFTAGESHGPGLTIIVEGVPAGLLISEDYIAAQLGRRQKGYGRGGRMLIEQDPLLLQQQIPPTALVYDLVYNPMETPLLRAAGRAGASTLGGIQMLVHQGAASFELWTGKPAPIPVMLEAATRAMAEAV